MNDILLQTLQAFQAAYAGIGPVGTLAVLAAGLSVLALWLAIGMTFGGAALAGLEAPSDDGTPLTGTEKTSALLSRIGRQSLWIADLFPAHAERLERQMEIASRPLGDLRGETYFAATAVLGNLAAIAVFVTAEAARRLGYLGDTSGMTVALLGLAVLAITQGAAWVILRSLAKHVSEDITLAFPFYLDLAVLTIRAGSLPLQTFSYYIEAEPRSFLAREFRITLREAEALGVEAGLMRMAARLDSPPVESILRNLSQAQRTTGSLSQFYAEQAIELRSLRQELAEHAINRMQNKLKFCEHALLAGIMIAVAAPVVAELEKMF